MNTAQLSIQQYIRAKDGNRPHLLDQAFTPSAILDMVVRTGSIAFPDHVEGRPADDHGLGIEAGVPMVPA
ncbi:hypothetical protein BSG18_27840 [Pseudomonas ogarae]|nr:hypothetical protein BSG18_27840 [Pseudomonas ogarae]